VHGGKPQETTSWLLADDRSKFHKEEIENRVAVPPAE
jgi:hypothetical protein